MADGEHLTGNVITDTLDNGHAVYCDNGCTYWTASGNALTGNVSNDWGSTHTDYRPGFSGHDPLLVSGNYWWQGAADNSGSGDNAVVTGNHVIATLAQAPAAIVRGAGLEPPYRHILSERFGLSLPDAPNQVAAFAADGTAYVGWNPTFVDNGLPVVSYTVTASPGGASTTISAHDLARIGYATISSLTDATPYTFTVTARNPLGSSAPSLPSAPVTPAPVTTAVPEAPTAVSAQPGDGAVSIHFTPPATTGATPIIGYTITAPGIAPVHVTGHDYLWATSGNALYAVVGGLTNGATYTFQITADNAIGPSAPASITATPSP